MNMRYEIILWYNGLLKLIPNQIGCKSRVLFFPYKQGFSVKIWGFVHIDFLSNLKIRDNISPNRGCVINAADGVCIVSDTLIGLNVTIYTKNHNFKNTNILIREQDYNRAKVIIGDNVWLASNVTILPGVRISDGIVVAANTLVNKDITEKGIYAGIPAKLIKKI